MKSIFPKAIIYLPTISIIVFIAIYIYATMIYNGGSQVDIDAEGFDWIHNYWCDLLGTIGRNDEFNPAALPSKLSLLVLAFGIMIFFWQFPKYISTTRFWNNTIRFLGLLSMLIGIFIFTTWHDVVIVGSGCCAFFALIGIYVGLAKHHFWFQLWFGVFGLMLMALNNLFYFILEMLYYLPLLQKVTFAIILIWVVSVNLKFEIPKKSSE